MLRIAAGGSWRQYRLRQARQAAGGGGGSSTNYKLEDNKAYSADAAHRCGRFINHCIIIFNNAFSADAAHRCGHVSQSHIYFSCAGGLVRGGEEHRRMAHSPQRSRRSTQLHTRICSVGRTICELLLRVLQGCLA